MSDGRQSPLIVRDLAPIFGAKEDELLKTIGILTRTLDGEGLRTDSGVHGSRGYEGDYLFMLLAGTTPIPPRVFKVMGTLGSRLFFLALHPNAKSHNELIAQNRGTDRRQKEGICRGATDLLLRTLWTANPGGVKWIKDDDPEDCLRVIARCAELLAALRGAIQIWHSEHDADNPADREKLRRAVRAAGSTTPAVRVLSRRSLAAAARLRNTSCPSSSP